MRTTLTIDDELSKDVLKITHEKTLAAAVNAALKKYVRQQKLLGIMELAGKLKFEGYDYKALRKDRELPWNE